MTRWAAYFRRAFVTASVAWAAALPLATFAASRSSIAPAQYLFALAAYLVGGAVCHQLDARSFHLWSHQMPVCARCTGIYVGAAMAALVASARTRAAPGAARPRAVFAVAALPTIATLLFEWTTGITPSNVVRAVAGLPLGAAVAWLVVYEVN